MRKNLSTRWDIPPDTIIILYNIMLHSMGADYSNTITTHTHTIELVVNMHINVFIALHRN